MAATQFSDVDSSYIHRQGVSPQTMSVVSSKNKIYAQGSNGQTTQIGVVATFDPSETRAVETIRGIGFGDQIAELVPGVTEAMSLSVNRTAQYLSMIYQVFGYKGGIDGLVRSLRHHRFPFDIHQELVFNEVVVPDDTEGTAEGTAPNTSEKGTEDSISVMDALLTTYEGCWFSDWGTSFAADTALVQENSTIMVSDVYAMTPKDVEAWDTGNSNASTRITDYLKPTA